MPVPDVLWSSAEEKEREWLFAKDKLSTDGKLLPNGTKLRRKDHPETLNHSFMVIDDRIIALSGKGIHLGKGRDAHAKLAEDEAGNLIALKIITKDGLDLNSVRESEIASDLGIAGQCITRASTSKRFPTKHYIAYEYLGTPLLEFFHSKLLSLDECYELSIKISLALHNLHTGTKAKSQKPYDHNDIHWDNLVIDDQGEIHFIDYGRAEQASQRKDDIVAMLLLFFTPIKNRNCRNEYCIFDNWIGEYAFSHEKPESNEKSQSLYLYVEPSDKSEDESFPQVHYLVLDPKNVLQKGVIDLSNLGLTKLPSIKVIRDKFSKLRLFHPDLSDERLAKSWSDSLSNKDLSLIQDKTLKVASQNNHIIDRENRNEVLFNLLKDPDALCRSPTAPTALDIAQTLTLCRLQLETYQDALTEQSPEVRLEVIHVLNSISPELLGLYKQLTTLPNADSLNQVVKNYIFLHLINTPKEVSEGFLDVLNVQLDETHTIKQYLDNLLVKMNHAKKAWRAKNAPSSQDESAQLSQPGLSDNMELKSPSIEVMESKLPAIEVMPPISHQNPESVTQEVQPHAESTIPQAEQDFLREFKNLQRMVAEQQTLIPTSSSMTIKQQSALKAALNEANQVLKELQKQLPLTEDEARLQSPQPNQAMLIQLADICSHTAQGLHFVARGGATFSCNLFYADSNTSGTLRQVNYDINMHQSGMKHLSNMASSLDGSGWKSLEVHYLC